MSEAAEQTVHSEPAMDLVRYEQPLNERMRTFLRLEFLYQQALYHSESPSPWATRAAVTSILEILSILTRGDLRTDVMKELERHSTILSDYQSRPGVDTGRLQTLLGNILSLREEIEMSGAQSVNRVRECEFLAAIKHRSAIPGGTCEFDLPDYSHWLNQPFDVRSADFNGWLSVLRPMCDGVAELLWLTRESGQSTPETASSGLFQQVLPRESTCQLLRVALPVGAKVYPEISGSQHRFTIRFLEWSDVDSRPAPTGEDVEFLLSLC